MKKCSRKITVFVCMKTLQSYGSSSVSDDDSGWRRTDLRCLHRISVKLFLAN